MDKILFRIPKNLTVSKIMISLGFSFFGGMLCLCIFMAFKNMTNPIFVLFLLGSIFFGVGMYYWALYFIREKQLLFDDEGIHYVYKHKGVRIVESIPWHQITKIEYWGHYLDIGDIIVHYQIPKEPYPYHRIDKKICFDIRNYNSVEGFRITSPKYVPRIKKFLEQICKEKNKQFVLT